MNSRTALLQFHLMKKFFTLLSLFLLIYSCAPADEPPVEEEPQQQPEPEPDPEPEPPQTGETEPINVIEVLPVKNDIGDTITIKGENFPRDLILSLNDNRLQPVLINDSVIKFKIPFGSYDPFNFVIKLKNDNEEKVLQNPYELYPPVIDSIPGLFGLRERVVLYGKHLLNPEWSKNNILFLDDLEIQVSSHTRDSIVFDLPWEVQKFEYDVLVKAQLQEVRMGIGLKIQPPAFERVSKSSVQIGEVITIYGSYFYPHMPDLHEISFQGNRAEVVEAYRDSLKVKIPMGPYKTRGITKLKIKLFESEKTYDVDMNITSTWYMYGYKRDHVITGGMSSVGNITRWSFAANGAYYFNVYRKNGESWPINNILYKYSPENDEWEEINLPIPEEDMVFGELLEFYPKEGTNDVFIYIHRSRDNFYKFNVRTGDLVKLKDFHHEPLLLHGTGFYANGNFYYGLGYTNDPGMEINKKFWKYNESTDNWSGIGNMPDVNETYPRFGTSIFRNGNSVIISNGHEQAYDLWEFTPNETWIRKADVLNPATNAIYVQKDQKGFYYDYIRRNFWEYNIPGDQWTRRDDLKIENYGTGHQTMFIHGNYVYYVGYLMEYGPDGTPYFRYDHAILRTELSNF